MRLRRRLERERGGCSTEWASWTVVSFVIAYVAYFFLLRALLPG